MPDQILAATEEEVAMDNRQFKAAILLLMVWATVLGIHAWDGWWLVWGVTLVLGLYALRLLTAKPLAVSPTTEQPLISLLVSAHNEESVVAQMVESLCSLDYPVAGAASPAESRYELWVIDDRSTDRTPQILDELADRYPQLQVFHRTSGGGGKSGALNQVLPMTKGELVGVFDADAQVATDCLAQIPAYFADGQVGALQLRKSILNADTNWLTAGQSIEMALDAYLQQQRVAVGGLGELRGNGQFIRRTALEACGGWNEETITDDLDLTFRLHLQGWKIQVSTWPMAGEEGVTSLGALWPQRSRWAEGGFQRYLDYWRSIFQGKAGSKTWDLLVFALMQYLLLAAALPDLLGAVLYQHAPMLFPLTLLGLIIQLFGMVAGGRRVDARLSWLTLIGRLPLGIFYMLHWIVVMPITTFGMALQPKQLKWVKTPRQGDFNF
jgi:1,2-diacylglycerol 3-beta-glucosyltransferase